MAPDKLHPDQSGTFLLDQQVSPAPTEATWTRCLFREARVVDLAEHDTFYEFTFSDDSMVSRCCLDYAFGIIIMDGAYTMEIRIGRSFEFVHRSIRLAIEPTNPESVCPVLSIFAEAVTNVRALKTGELAVRLQGGDEILVGAGDGYEPWELSTSRGEKIVSLPSSGLAVWPESAINMFKYCIGR
jgi:hypothetical protein